jgi:hypothetical protein
MRSTCCQVLQVFGGGGLVLETDGREHAIPVPVPADGRYRVEVKPIYSRLELPMTLRLDGGQSIVVRPQVLPKEDSGQFLFLGEAVALNGCFTLHVAAPHVATLQAILLTKL